MCSVLSVPRDEFKPEDQSALACADRSSSGGEGSLPATSTLVFGMLDPFVISSGLEGGEAECRTGIPPKEKRRQESEEGG